MEGGVQMATVTEETRRVVKFQNVGRVLEVWEDDSGLVLKGTSILTGTTYLRLNADVRAILPLLVEAFPIEHHEEKSEETSSEDLQAENQRLHKLLTGEATEKDMLRRHLKVSEETCARLRHELIELKKQIG